MARYDKEHAGPSIWIEEVPLCLLPIIVSQLS